MRRRAQAVLLLLGVGCSGLGDPGDDTPDAGDTCGVSLDVTTTAQAVPFTAHVEAVSTRLDAVASYAWTVTNGGESVRFTESNTVGSAIDFEAIDPGSYVVTVTVTSSLDSCGARTTVTAPPPGAIMRSYRLRFTPYQPSDPPPQDDPAVLTVYGGTIEIPADQRHLGDGIPVAGTVLDAAGAPLAAYLRFLPALGLQATEILVGDSGAWSRNLAEGAYDAIVAPVAELPALSLHGVTLAELETLTVDQGDRVSGTVVRATAGGPVALVGARVAVHAGVVPAVMATTDAAGAWQARVRTPYGPLSVRVVPPAGLPELTVDGVTVAPDATVSASYAQANPSTLYTLTIRDSTGALLPDATVTFVSSSIPATAGGSITIAGVAHAATASARAVAVSDATGRLTVTLPNGAYQVGVEPPSSATGEAPARYTPSLSGGSLSANASTVAAQSLAVTVRDSAGEAVEGARVTVISRGFDGLGAGRAAVRDTDASGLATLSITPGVAHDVLIDPPAAISSRPLARLRTSLTVAESTLPVTLPDGIVIHGQVVFPLRTGGPGIRVEAFCLDCDPAGPLVTGETLTRSGGMFDLHIPDPGVQ